MWTIPIINGPNLNLTGTRELEIYGSQSFDHLLEGLRSEWKNVNFPYHQSNHEGDLIDWLHAYRSGADAIVMNPGGLTHTSVALRDAVAALPVPLAEVHLSDVRRREVFRRVSLLRDVRFIEVSGYGLVSYRMAILRLMEYLGPPAEYKI
ncbi:MAG: 3-dehydroquinate dehydratase [Saprospiraceae bacterium]|jgi:3-dehydroquinate dehydratase-2|nr:3-dehydroquinate dehydratase [Saprospiraceae bacterium]MBP9208984.1 3-dehydroquinate dehydratase [Saprospiraceae bacterium]MBV6472779.1 3-dehydroquinate dehydratase 1 [Saprospiraceae bacterium]